jgi:hypothetical protein
MFLTEPFAEVNQPAPTRAERSVFARKPVSGFFANRTFYPANALTWFPWQSF